MDAFVQEKEWNERKQSEVEGNSEGSEILQANTRENSKK
jgi:hypothetical protein